MASAILTNACAVLGVDADQVLDWKEADGYISLVLVSGHKHRLKVAELQPPKPAEKPKQRKRAASKKKASK